MNIELTEKEKQMLSQFAEKQYDGAKDNLGTVTPIHVVERIRTEYVESPDGNEWLYVNDDDCKNFEDFNELIAYAEKVNEKVYPSYDRVLYEEINGVWIDDEKSYLEAYGIKAFPCRAVKYTEPVAFFLIRDEAKRYKDEYQAHNCANCRIYTYGLGYANKGDLPIFRALLMRMGQALRVEQEAEE